MPIVYDGVPRAYDVSGLVDAIRGGRKRKDEQEADDALRAFYDAVDNYEPPPREGLSFDPQSQQQPGYGEPGGPIGPARPPAQPGYGEPGGPIGPAQPGYGEPGGPIGPAQQPRLGPPKPRETPYAFDEGGIYYRDEEADADDIMHSQSVRMAMERLPAALHGKLRDYAMDRAETQMLGRGTARRREQLQMALDKGWFNRGGESSGTDQMEAAEAAVTEMAQQWLQRMDEGPLSAEEMREFTRWFVTEKVEAMKRRKTQMRVDYQVKRIENLIAQAQQPREDGQEVPEAYIMDTMDVLVDLQSGHIDPGEAWEAARDSMSGGKAHWERVKILIEEWGRQRDAGLLTEEQYQANIQLVLNDDYGFGVKQEESQPTTPPPDENDGDIRSALERGRTGEASGMLDIRRRRASSGGATDYEDPVNVPPPVLQPR